MRAISEQDPQDRDRPADSMELDEHLEPDAQPAGVRRHQQDTRPVDGEAALNQPQDGTLGIKQPIQG
jgi:hypothetical protein